jgi:Contractile injection system tube protein/LysM domain
MALTKMVIRNLDTNESVTDERVKVLFNPTEYTLEQSNTWETQHVQGQEPRTQFTKSDLRKLNMELFFDSYEEVDGSGQPVDVRTYTERVARLMIVSIDEGNDGKRPPIVEITWCDAPSGLTNPDFPFKGVLLSLRQQFVLFSDQGRPVRAKVVVGFQEYLSPDEIEQRFPRRGSFPARTYTVKQGDSLPIIAQEVWKKPTEWRRIAVANSLRDPRTISAGMVLDIPMIE